MEIENYFSTNISHNQIPEGSIWDVFSNEQNTQTFYNESQFNSDKKFDFENTTQSKKSKAKNSVKTNKREKAIKYTLFEDFEILKEVSFSSDKLMAKQIIAKKFGRSFHSILNRFQILRQIPESDLYKIYLTGTFSDEIAKKTESMIIKACHNSFRLNSMNIPDFEYEQNDEKIAQNFVQKFKKTIKKESFNQNKESKVNKRIYKSRVSKPEIGIIGQGEICHTIFLKALLKKVLNEKTLSVDDLSKMMFRKVGKDSSIRDWIVDCSETPELF